MHLSPKFEGEVGVMLNIQSNEGVILCYVWGRFGQVSISMGMEVQGVSG